MRKMRADITGEQLRSLYHYDSSTGVFVRKVRAHDGPWNWNARYAGKVAGFLYRGYSFICIERRTYAAHRLAFLYIHDRWPVGEIDHANGDRSDNRIANLREATNSQNQFNKGPNQNNTSGFKGVSWCADKKRWAARIRVNRRLLNLGRYKTPEAAHAAYVAAALRYAGEFSRAT